MFCNIKNIKKQLFLQFFELFMPVSFEINIICSHLYIVWPCIALCFKNISAFLQSNYQSVVSLNQLLV